MSGFNGLRVKVVLRIQSSGYEDYLETFVHPITGKGKKKQRVFDRHRADKRHWIKCILENRNDDEVIWFNIRKTIGAGEIIIGMGNVKILVKRDKVTLGYLIITIPY